MCIVHIVAYLQRNTLLRRVPQNAKVSKKSYQTFSILPVSQQFVVKRAIIQMAIIQGKSPQNGTERVSVTSAKTFFSLKDWAKMKSESSIIYVIMEKKHSGQAPTLGL